MFKEGEINKITQL